MNIQTWNVWNFDDAMEGPVGQVTWDTDEMPPFQPGTQFVDFPTGAIYYGWSAIFLSKQQRLNAEWRLNAGTQEPLV